jgi:outer membrane protein TolC
MIRRNFLILVTLCICSLSAIGQNEAEIKAINLETVLQLAGADNLSIQESNLKQKVAEANLHTAQEWWLPNVYAGASVHQLWGSAMNGNGVFFTDVNRQNMWGGIGVNGSWDFGSNLNKVKAQKLNVEAMTFETQAQKNRVLLKSVESYYDFLNAQLNYEAYQELASQSENITKQIGNQVKAGLKVESEYLLAQSNLNHLKIEMLNAKQEQLSASNALKILLNLPGNFSLQATDTALFPIQLTLDILASSNEDMYKARPEIASLELGLKALDQEKKTVTSGLWAPTLALNTYTSYFGDVVSPLYPTSAINASLLWDINLGRALKGGQVEEYDARIALQKNQLEQAKTIISNEVELAKHQKQLAKESAAIALEGSQLAKKALDQTIARQQLGTAIPLEILQAQELYIKLRLDYLKAVANHNKAEYAWYVASGGVL